MGKSLQVIAVSTGAAAAVVSVYLVATLSGSAAGMNPDQAAAVAVSALPPTSLPTLGREAIEPVPQATRTQLTALEATQLATPEADTWEGRRAEADSVAWTATEETVAALALRHSWSDTEQDSVLTALRWRHDRMADHRQAMQSGDLDPAEGRTALAEAAEAARNTVIAAVGAERAEALSIALSRSSLGAGL